MDFSGIYANSGEDNLKRRMALARSQGWSDDEIQRSAAVERALAQRQSAEGAAVAPSDNGGIAETLLSFVPFGNIARKAVTGQANQITGDEVAMEALLSAVPFGIGKIGKIAKIGKGAAKTVKKVNRGTTPSQLISPEDAAKKDVLEILQSEKKKTGHYWQQRRATGPERFDESIYGPSGGVPGKPMAAATAVADETIQAPGIRQKFADYLTRRGSGLTPGKNVGSANLDEKVRVHQKLGITGTPKAQHDKILQTITDLDDEVDHILVKTPNNLQGTDVRAKLDTLRADPTAFAEVRLDHPLVGGEVERYLKMFDAMKGGKGINDIVKVVNPIAIKAQSKMAAGLVPTPNEQAAIAVKRAADEVLTTIPAIRPYKTEMAVLFDSFKDVAGQLDRGANIPVLGGALKAPATAGRYLQSKAGAALSQTGKAAAEPKGTTLPRELGKQAAVRGGADLLGLRQDGTEDPSGLLDPSNSGAPNDLMSMPGSDVLGDMPAGKSPLQRKLEEDFLLTGGKNAGLLEKLYGGERMNATQQKQLMGTAQARSLVGQLGASLAELEQQGNTGRIGGLIGMGQGAIGMNDAVKAYEDARPSMALMIIKAIMGSAGNISDADRNAINSSIPSAMDTTGERVRKLTTLNNIIAAYEGGVSAGAGPGSANDLLTQLNGL